MEDSVTTDVSHILGAFNFSVWIIIIISLISFIILIKVLISLNLRISQMDHACSQIRIIKRRKKRKRNVWLIKEMIIKMTLITKSLITKSLITKSLITKSLITKSLSSDWLVGLWTVIKFILLNPSFKIGCNLNTFPNYTKLINLIISTFVLLVVISCFKNGITTDRIRLKEQKIYTGYEEIVADIQRGRNLTFLFTQQSTFLLGLKENPRNLIKYQLDKYISAPSTVKINVWPLMLLKILDQKYDFVFIDGQLTTKIMKFYACTMMQPSPGKRL